ncbi:hypothetical protein LINPERHAP2_LOCUS39578 [Linum perenne]
MILRSS